MAAVAATPLALHRLVSVELMVGTISFQRLEHTAARATRMCRCRGLHLLHKTGASTTGPLRCTHVGGIGSTNHIGHLASNPTMDISKFSLATLVGGAASSEKNSFRRRHRHFSRSSVNLDAEDVIDSKSASGADVEPDKQRLVKPGSPTSTAGAIGTGSATVIKMTAKKAGFRTSSDTHKTTDRNFVTALRAMNEYLLKPSDLDSLRKIYRRSPYDTSRPPIAVFLRKDIEAKALEVWGSQDALIRELKKKNEQDQRNRESIFEVKKILRQFQMRNEATELRETLWKGSGRVVLTAVVINASNFLLKLLAWVYTGSHSMFSEAIHSFADTCNQLILAYGIHKSIQKADQNHPYGYTNMRYVASLISGVGIFFFGTGLSLYHGIMGLLYMEPVGQLYWAFFILGGSLVSESATLMVAMSAIKKGAKDANMSFMDYVIETRDPSVNVVLLEDIAAVMGVGIAALCMGLSTYLDSPIPDAIGSCLIGGLLGLVASFIIKTNIAALTGRSVPVDNIMQINKELENDVMIRAIHDAKCIDMGNSIARYKAEIDFDGRELTKSYLDKQDLELILEEMQNLKTIGEVESFMLKHGESVIDMVGAEIDRIETQLKKKHPEIRHCDLEML